MTPTRRSAVITHCDLIDNNDTAANVPIRMALNNSITTQQRDCRCCSAVMVTSRDVFRIKLDPETVDTKDFG
jgi:hypothetical protein